MSDENQAETFGGTPPLQIAICRIDVWAENRQVAFFEGRVAGGGRTPFLNACRELLRQGYDPAFRVEVRWQGSDTVSMRGTLGGFAKLAVRESPSIGPRFVKYQPILPHTSRARTHTHEAAQCL